jgi:hypothetical protein
VAHRERRSVSGRTGHRRRFMSTRPSPRAPAAAAASNDPCGLCWQSRSASRRDGRVSTATSAFRKQQFFCEGPDRTSRERSDLPDQPLQLPLRGGNRSRIAITVSVTSATKTKPSASAISCSGIPYDPSTIVMRGVSGPATEMRWFGRSQLTGLVGPISCSATLPARAKAGGTNARGRSERNARV